MRDGVCDVTAQSWYQRLLDLLFPKLAARRRVEAIAQVYKQWQDARPAPVEAADIKPLNNAATSLALHMVRSQRGGRHYAEAKSLSVTDAQR